MKNGENPRKRIRPFGFTLAELIVVVSILATLATVGFLAFSGYSQDAKDSATKANVRSVRTAISTESATTGNTPRFYVVHDTGAALSGAYAYVDGSPVVLSGGDWNVLGTNYSAGNPDYAKLKLNRDKFRIASESRFFPSVWAAYDPKYLTVGVFDWNSTASGKKRTGSFVQVAGVSVSGVASVTGDYPTTGSGVTGLVRDPNLSSTGALVDGANSSLPHSPVDGVCGGAAKNYAFSASSFGSDTFCSVGMAFPASPAFPSAGSSVSWTCSAQNGGTVPTCTANHAAAANCPASTQTANSHSYSVSALANGAGGTFSSTGAVTGGYRTFTQAFSCSDGAVSASGSESAGAITCTSAGYALVGGACVPNSCLAIRDAGYSTGDGPYSIDPDGAGATTSTTGVYCDMTTNGGGWTLISNRRANSNNAESCGSNIATFFTNGCGTASAISASDSYAANSTFRNALSKQEYLLVQFLNGTADSDDAYILRVTGNADLFPNTSSLQHIALTSVCDVNNASCDTTNVYWKYVGDYWFHSDDCNSSSSGLSTYRGNYGVCHNGASNSGNASTYVASGAFGDRNTEYSETKLWSYSGPSASYQERIFVR